TTARRLRVRAPLCASVLPLLLLPFHSLCGSLLADRRRERFAQGLLAVTDLLALLRHEFRPLGLKLGDSLLDRSTLVGLRLQMRLPLVQRHVAHGLGQVL